MKRRRSSGTIVATMLGLCLASAHANGDLTMERQQQLRHMLLQDCGSCHGLTMQGGLGPALTPASLAGKDSKLLRTVILEGRPGTPMPPWKPFMNEVEADWLVAQLQRGVSADAR